MNYDTKSLFDKVLFIGPDIKDKGGISSVLASYADTLPVFHHIASNSRYGTLPGAINLLILLLRLPVERLRGRRLLHIHGAVGKSWIRKTIIMRWGRLLGFKTLFHCHAGMADNWFKKIGMGKARSVLDCYDGIIALSESWRKYFSKTFNFDDKIFTVNNIVMPAKTDAEPRKTDGRVNFLYLGLLCDRKGIFDLLQALHDGVSGEYNLSVGGNGEVERFKDEVSRLGLEQNVEYVGWVTGDMKENLLRRCDVLILPSYFEGLPISVLEAMARRKAVIATTVGGIPELITDKVNGFLVNPGDTDALAKAIDRYIAEPGLAATHGQASAKRIAPYYPDAVVKSLAEIYNHFLN